MNLKENERIDDLQYWSVDHPEHRENISKGSKASYENGREGVWYGKHLSEETKQKISNTKIEKASNMTPEERKEHFNPHHTDESKAKIKAARAKQDMSYTQTEQDLISFGEDFEIPEPKTILEEVKNAVSKFRILAHENGIPQNWIDRISEVLGKLAKDGNK